VDEAFPADHLHSDVVTAPREAGSRRYSGFPAYGQI
jgi:hypothetical protein